MPENPVSILVDRMPELEKALTELAQMQVLVGIPSDEESHYGQGAGGAERRRDATIGNAALGYIHEFGSPIRNIPARPFLTPGVQNSKEQWTSYLGQAGQAAIEGRSDVSLRALHAAGLAAVSSVKAHIVAGIPPPLKQSTIDDRRRRRRSRVAAGPSDVTPLVDTAQLLNSISYVIRKGK